VGRQAVDRRRRRRAPTPSQPPGGKLASQPPGGKLASQPPGGKLASRRRSPVPRISSSWAGGDLCPATPRCQRGRGTLAEGAGLCGPPMGAPARLAVHHLAVVVRDLDRAEAFYAGALGLPVERRWTDEAGAPRSVWLGLGGDAFLAVERAAATSPAP